MSIMHEGAAADFKRWNRTLRESELDYLDQIRMHNMIIVLRDEYLKLSESYQDKLQRLQLIHGPINVLAHLVADFRRGGVFDVGAAVFVVEQLVKDFREMESE